LSQGVSSAEAEDDHKPQGDFELVDMTRPLEGDCVLELITFEDKIGK
jgi:hypothetical protein